MWFQLSSPPHLKRVISDSQVFSDDKDVYFFLSKNLVLCFFKKRKVEGNLDIFPGIKTTIWFSWLNRYRFKSVYCEPDMQLLDYGVNWNYIDTPLMLFSDLGYSRWYWEWKVGKNFSFCRFWKNSFICDHFRNLISTLGEHSLLSELVKNISNIGKHHI